MKKLIEKLKLLHEKFRPHLEEIEPISLDPANPVPVPKPIKPREEKK